MTKVRTMMLVQGLLSGGMIYALLSIFAVPAAACTPSQCSALAQSANAFCEVSYHCGGHLVECNSSYDIIYCDCIGNIAGYCQ